MTAEHSSCRVALVFSPHMDYEVRVFASIRHWRAWPVPVRFRQFAPGPGRDPWPEVDAWQPDGVIGHMADPVTIRHLEQLAHVVRVAPSTDGTQPADVGLDHDGLARMAVTHLRAVGYTALACVGWRIPFTSAMRRAAVEAGLELLEFSIDRLREYSNGSSPAVTLPEQLARWVVSLPKPVGILCEFDPDAVRLADVCLEAELGIPQEVGILAAGTSAHTCDLNDPQLSNMVLPGDAIGRAAAERMSALLGGREPPASVSFPPTGIRERASTARINHPDPAVRRAVQHLRAEALRGITVGEVVQRSGISRRKFEMAVKQALGHSPGVELRQIRLREAARLLSETRLTIQEIADQCGYGSAHHFHYVFRRAHGRTPQTFRRAVSQNLE